MRRLRVSVRGIVQGVGFRPFVWRLAEELGLKGYVLNSTEGVIIEVEGDMKSIREFLVKLQKKRPRTAFIQSMEPSFLDPVGFKEFNIKQSLTSGEKKALILPDISTCEECLEDIKDPHNRRYRYPFTTCTYCGPRFTIIEDMPYDRPRTSMKIFPMCPECEGEYKDPSSRRFHAQIIACPECGPYLILLDENGKIIAEREDALELSAWIVEERKILALKGIGGFQLIVDAKDGKAVAKLRERKRREEKPFALMMPDVKTTKEYCHMNEMEERILTSPESPIVLLRRKAGIKIADEVAPRNPYLGVMLPYSPIHHMLMERLKIPIVATSGNLTDEPIVTDEEEAIQRLKGVADAFLVHRRPILRHMDDSVAFISGGREIVIRRARGYAPLPVLTKVKLRKVLALGAHLKNTIAISSSEKVFVSQHIGDLETYEAVKAFENVIDDFLRLFNFEPELIACDMHPEYISTKYAEEISSKLKVPLVKIQHHHAHAVSCMAENELSGEVLAISWDGTGFGTDGTVWGGEFLLCDYKNFRRVATFRKFPLPGGEKAIKEPRRVAIAILEEIGAPILEHLKDNDIDMLLSMVRRGLNSPLCSSVGRLFDAMSAILGLKLKSSFEGQAAMELQFCAENSRTKDSYPFELEERDGIIEIDWRPIFSAALDDGSSKEDIAMKFHDTLVDVIRKVVDIIGAEKVVLSGGCFQNRILLNKLSEFYFHQRVPPNDGGISLGQAVSAGVIL